MERLSLRRHIALEIHKKLQDDVIAEHPLRQLFWECTLRCDLHCRHCGSDCKQTALAGDMSKEDFGRVLDSVSARTHPHKVMVNITGGEPLMRPDLDECGRMIYEKGFPWGMVTNALALTPERYLRLLHNGLRAMSISLDGLEDSHDWMRGREGSFKRASAAIRMVTGSGAIAFDVVTCVNRRNFGQLAALKEHLISLGVRDWRLFTVFPAGRAAGNPELFLSREELRGLMEFIRNTRKEGIVHTEFACEGFLGNYEGDVRDHFYMCNAGITIGSVLADGSISACPSIRANYVQRNIYQDDFMEVWEKSYLPYRDRSWMYTDECADCPHWKYCRGGGMHLRDDDGNLIQCLLRRM